MKVIVIFFLFIFVGCSNVPKKAWRQVNKEKNFLNIETGDIILKERQLNILGLFGHIGIMKTDRLVVDYPKLGKNIEVIDINYWLEKDRKFIILRYVGMNKEFKEKLIKNLDTYIELNRPYKINFNVKSESGFYCSQFIWYIYYKTAKELGIDLKKYNSFLFFPYDFIYSKDFYIIF